MWLFSKVLPETLTRKLKLDAALDATLSLELVNALVVRVRGKAKDYCTVLDIAFKMSTEGLGGGACPMH
jgi:hypothetical protein